jgi:hypothetical protein
MRAFYLTCFVAGCLLPLSQFVPWLAEHGPSISQLVRTAAATPISRFAWLDVVVAAVALVGWICVDAARGRVRHWWLSLLLTVTVGVSAGLPLHLYLRSRSGQAP